MSGALTQEVLSQFVVSSEGGSKVYALCVCLEYNGQPCKGIIFPIALNSKVVAVLASSHGLYSYFQVMSPYNCEFIIAKI